MRKKGTEYFKTVRYICMVFVIALGLMTILGTGGGGGGGGGDITAPEDVTSLSALPCDSKVSLSWTASANSEGDLAGQKVFYSSDGGTTYMLAESALSASATSYEVTELTNGTAYKFKIACYDEVPNESSGATVSCYANAPLSDSDMPVQSGLTDNGVAMAATQKMTGTVPNPTGSSDSYGGKAYLVLNGDKIPLSVTSSSRASGRMIYKEGKEYYLDDADAIDLSVLSKGKARSNGDVAWVFEVTFSVNAGPNTIRIEVYDLNDSLFARTDQWDIVGAIEPTSLVITLWWNTDKTDIDLHVSPDDGVTHCYYVKRTAGDMVLDYDDVNGYGPEHVTVNEVTGTKTYKIKVYYYADHNESETTTATTANITAAVSGETKLSASHLMTVESTSSSWGTGSHIWDAGELEVSGADVYSVTLSDPDLTAFPTVKLTVEVADSDANPVEGLTSANFYVVNAGTLMSPVTVTEGSSSYTLTYTDITSGARDLYVYVYVPAEGDTPMKGGLSNTKTYGTNYALLVGLNEYPASVLSTCGGEMVRWYDSGGSAYVEAKVSKTPDGAGDFEATLKDTQGGTNRPDVTVGFSAIENLGAGKYKLTLNQPANYLDYDTITVKYKKECWLSWCVADITDVETALKAKGTLMDNSAWVDANIHTLTNSGATKTAIFSKITEIKDGMEKYDAFLFHFSGHGSGMPAAGDASQYLCAYEDDAWISVTYFSTKLGEIPDPGSNITNVFVTLDACHSGNFIGKDMNFIRKGIDGADLSATLKYRPFLPQRESETSDFAGLAFSRDLTGTNLFVISAVTGSKSAWDVGALQNGVFTYYLVDGINTTSKYISGVNANANNDTWITGEEAFNYLEPKAKKYVEDNILPTNPDASQEAQYWPDLTTNSRLIYNW